MLAQTPYNTEPANALIAKHAALQYPYKCQFGRANLEIDKGVFCPTLTNVSPLLLKSIGYRRGERVLDAFSGSGAFGIDAALHGAHVVVAVDVDQTAVDCARKNAVLNNVSSIVEVRTGTVADSIADDESFDLIIANPPLLPGNHRGLLSEAIFDPGLKATVAFIKALPLYLAEDGRCYLVTSDVMSRVGIDIDQLCHNAGLMANICSSRSFGYETYRVYRITRHSGHNHNSEF